MSTERAKNGQDHHDLFIALTFGHKDPNQLTFTLELFSGGGTGVNTVQATSVLTKVSV